MLNQFCMPEIRTIWSWLIILFVVLQSLSRVWPFATPWTAVRQAFLSFTISRSLRKLKSTESVMPSNQLVLCHPLVLLPSIFPSIRVFSNELVLHIRRPKYWRFSLSISPSSEYSGLTSFRIDSEKVMAPHSSTLAWRIPRTGEPGGLMSLGSHRAGHDWSDLAAAGLTDLISLQSKGLSRVFSNTTVSKHQFFCTQPSLRSNSHIHTWLLEKP